VTAELWTQLIGGIMLFIAVSGALWGIWWRIEGKVDTARKDALERVESARKEAAERVDIARKEASEKASAAILEASNARIDLAAHKLHCSETFATKQGMHEQTSQLLRAIESVGNRIEGMNERLDRAFEASAPAPRRRAP
jgi:hypothetical protein